VHVGADIFAFHHLLEVAHNVHVEDVDGEVVLLAHGGGGEVHHLESAGVDLVVGDLGELGGGGVLLGVGGVDAVDAGALEHHIGLNLDAAKRRAGVGGEVGVAGAAAEDDHLAGLHAVDGLPLGVELTDGLHADGGEHAGLDTDGGEGRAQREAVDDGGEHTHLVALHTVEALAGSREAAEDVAATDDDTYLHAHVVDFLNLCCIFAQTLLVDAVALLAHEALATEFEEDSVEFCHVLFEFIGL